MSRYDAIAEWYDEVASRWAGPEPDGSAAWLARLLGPGQGWCPDLACGGGRHAAAIQAAGRTVVGLDLSAGQLRVARRRRLRHLVRVDATWLPVGAAAVDAAVLAYVHTDVDDVAPVFAEVARVLRPGSRLVFLGGSTRASWSTGRGRAGRAARRLPPGGLAPRLAPLFGSGGTRTRREIEGSR